MLGILRFLLGLNSSRRALLPFGRAPAVEAPQPKQRNYEKLRALLWPAIALGIVFKALEWADEQGLLGELPALNDALARAWAQFLTLAAALVLVRIVITTIGHLNWSVQRLHDLDRPGWHAWRPLLFATIAWTPMLGIAFVLDQDASLSAAAVFHTTILAGTVWAGAFYLSFWSQQMLAWQDEVETIPGNPRANRYGPPPSAAFPSPQAPLD